MSFSDLKKQSKLGIPLARAKMTAFGNLNLIKLETVLQLFVSFLLLREKIFPGQKFTHTLSKALVVGILRTL